MSALEVDLLTVVREYAGTAETLFHRSDFIATLQTSPTSQPLNWLKKLYDMKYSKFSLRL